MARSDIDAFCSWLRLQLGRDDRIGDFARDFLVDACARKVATISSLDQHLREYHGAEDKVLESRDLAWREYAQTASG